MIPKQIARQMGVEPRGVRAQLHRALQKLTVNTPPQAVVACIHAGWIDAVAENPEPLRFGDCRATAAQRVCPDAFDRRLRAGDEAIAVAEAERLTEAALVALDEPPRSLASQDWIGTLFSGIARVGSQKPSDREAA
jgi:hypothetical protein